jgi:aspartate/methionine/tyrosine aminotransferase
MFSSRLPAALEPNAITRAARALRARAVPLLDLTETNPTSVNLVYPADVLTPLASAEARRYTPDPLGLPSARAAVAREYERSGARVDPGRVMLTASTSEAYALLFKLLCDAGDEVLVPQPSYPLFESLTSLDAVRARPYRLEYYGGWSIDRQSVDRALGPRTRAVLVVSPNNPTGSMLRADDREWLVARARQAGAAIVADEVFADYPLRPGPGAASCVGESRVLTFVLGGLSKSAGLPQVKLGWIVASGPEAQVAEAMERLEVIGDAYLSVSTPVQVAAPALIERGRAIRARIQERLATNLAGLERMVAGSAVTLLPPEGGWSAVLRVPAVESEESLVLRLLNDAHVLVHPGFFFDFADEAFVVLSLLPEPAEFEEGVRRVIALADAGRGA